LGVHPARAQVTYELESLAILICPVLNDDPARVCRDFRAGEQGLDIGNLPARSLWVVVTSLRPNRRVTGHHALSGSDQASTPCDDSLATSAIFCASITPF